MDSTTSDKPTLTIDIPGIDAEDALERLKWRTELLTRLLASFVAKNKNAASAIQQHLAQGDLAQAQHMTHDIKGTAANLGATSLSQASATIERLLKTGASEIESSLVEKLGEEFVVTERYLEALTHFQEQSSPQASAFDTAEYRATLTAILGTIDSDLLETSRTIAKIRNIDGSPEQMQTANEIVQAFDSFNKQSLKETINNYLN